MVLVTKMANESAIGNLLKMAEIQPKFISQSNNSKELIADVKKEVDFLKGIPTIRDEGQVTIKTLEEIVNDFYNRQYQSVQAKCLSAKSGFESYLSEYLKYYQRGNTQNTQDRDQMPDVETQQKPNAGSPQDLSGSTRQPQNGHNTYPDNKKSIVSAEQDEILKEREKRKRIQANNPDIADLSDANRPTKLAEKFSELYDNEWTEVFESLGNNRKIEEKKLIALLLQVVENAYQYCASEADKQIHIMKRALLDIIEFGKLQNQGNKGNATRADVGPETVSPLKEFRKAYGHLAIGYLKETFIKERLPDIYKKHLQKPPPISNEDPMAKYARKAVEITWWMCLQDPPVFMCPTTQEKFDTNLYRAYTKSGKEPDFFVWPALRLYADGGVLVKGVVQFKPIKQSK